MTGWVKLPRSLLDDPLWPTGRINRLDAWLYLLLSAHWHTGALVLDTSQVELARRWGWSPRAVSRFLQTLRTRGWIATEAVRYPDEGSAGFTTIRILPGAMGLEAPMVHGASPPMVRGTATPHEDVPSRSDGLAPAPMVQPSGAPMLGGSAPMVAPMVDDPRAPMVSPRNRRSRSTDSAPGVARAPMVPDTRAPMVPPTSSQTPTERVRKNPPYPPDARGGSDGLSASRGRIETGPERIGPILDRDDGFMATLARCATYGREPEARMHTENDDHPTGDDGGAQAPAPPPGDDLEVADPDDDPSVTGRPRRWGDLVRYGWGAGNVGAEAA